jgi:transposase-like protein
MVEAVVKNDVKPVCPHCKSEVSSIHYQKMSGVFGKKFIYFCPNCKSVLGISHRKGFWMG